MLSLFHPKAKSKGNDIGAEINLDMEAWYFRLHCRLIKSVTYFFNDNQLKFFEYCLLLNALLSLILLLYLHSVVVAPHGDAERNCFSKSLQHGLAQFQYAQGDENGVLTPGLMTPDIVRVQVKGIWKRLAEDDKMAVEKVEKLKTEKLGENKHTGKHLAPDLLEVWLQDPTYIFSLERGYLLLNKTLRETHGISEHVLDLDTECFSFPWLTFVLDNFVGYDTIVMNSFIDFYGDNGYLMSTMSRKIFSLRSAGHSAVAVREREVEVGTVDAFMIVTTRLKIVCMTFFLIFITTSLAHDMFCATQERVLRFAFDLRARVESNLPYYVPVLAHGLSSLVFIPILIGMVVFLVEFFDDQILALMVLAVAWLSELFAMTMMRTLVSIKLFPKVYILLFTCFHLYFFAFPSGFSYLGLTTTILFLTYSMLFLWNRYERPALRANEITFSAPREAILDRKKLNPSGIDYASLAHRAFLPSEFLLVIKASQGNKTPPLALNKDIHTNRSYSGQRKKRPTLNMHPLLNETDLLASKSDEFNTLRQRNTLR
eukprot:CAMPEP_0204837114 /NCGR_PEP_ID=MMETSP1346-20131115/27197_1 /ASSEMBLY_ACC=CAM_ASM_000771 /TAXON_ID=215587 /ORGANISM="Aplanochytrium stocchinoi, Strain GSBS06" /LENGTH=541 /DNA_ID=CAMNT_0051972383 /DNA_START=206 /DNA_END=1831 /DNA_ORIENTATION=-